MKKQKWIVVFPIVQVQILGYPESVTVFAHSEAEAGELAEKKARAISEAKTTQTT